MWVRPVQGQWDTEVVDHVGDTWWKESVWGINLSVYKIGNYTILHGANSGPVAVRWPNSSYQGDCKSM